MVFYSQPDVESITPIEVDVGRIATVTLLSTDDTEFFDPISVDSLPSDDSAGASRSQSTLSPLKCRFGRFGESTGVFVNSTAIKCTTPPTDEPPDSIYRETVTVSVAMNGQDFLEDTSTAELTFVGTAPYISFAAIVLTVIAIAFVGFAATMCTAQVYEAGQLGDIVAWGGASSGPPGARA